MGTAIKNLAILGSTGSIGRQTLDVVRALSQHFRVIALAAGSNVALLQEQAREFNPGYICYDTGRSMPSLSKYKFIQLEDMVVLPDVDIVVAATSGKAGLRATLAAAGAGKTIALSNKGSLVMAGEIITVEAKKHNAEIRPVDSEHSAIWQCLRGETRPARIILTASGGPFRGYSRKELSGVTAEQALKHPSWKMGTKVTIDSATLMNKGLEIIEAHWLFDMPVENINVVIHPQSIIHSMVEFADGSTKAQLSYPDMRMPIQYALTWPERLPNPELRKIDWYTMKDLTFSEPDFDLFPCLRLAIEAVNKGGTYPAALCAADEAAVKLFLDGKIQFTDIPELIERVMDEHESIPAPSIDDIMEADALTEQKIHQIWQSHYRR